MDDYSFGRSPMIPEATKATDILVKHSIENANADNYFIESLSHGIMSFAALCQEKGSQSGVYIQWSGFYDLAKNGEYKKCVDLIFEHLRTLPQPPDPVPPSSSSETTTDSNKPQTTDPGKAVNMVMQHIEATKEETYGEKPNDNTLIMQGKPPMVTGVSGAGKPPHAEGAGGKKGKKKGGKYRIKCRDVAFLLSVCKHKFAYTQTIAGLVRNGMFVSSLYMTT